MPNKNALLFEARKIDYSLRSTFFYRKLHELGFLDFAEEIEKLVKIADTYNWDNYQDWGISSGAWLYIAHINLNPLKVFAHPRVIIEQSKLIAYYRSIAALSQKAVKYFTSTSIEVLENGKNKKSLSHPKALELCTLLNTHVSSIIDSSLLTFSQQDLDALLYASAGSQINGAWLNAIGVEAEMVIRRLLITEFARQDRIVNFLDKNNNTVSELSGEEILEKIATFKGFRLKEQASILFSSEPDIAVLGKNGRTLAAIEIKGGKDAAGALERYGAAKKSFEEIARYNPDVKTIFVASCITDEVKQRLDNDALFQYTFELTEVVSTEDKRVEFVKLVQQIIETSW